MAATAAVSAADLVWVLASLFQLDCIPFDPAPLVIDSAANGASGASSFTVGMLVALRMFASRMSQPMLRLVDLWQQVPQADISVRPESRASA